MALQGEPHGEANDCPLVRGLLAQVRRIVPGARLFIADRQFCGAEQLDEFSRDGDHFLAGALPPRSSYPIRIHCRGSGSTAAAVRTVDRRGTLYKGAKARPVRQITSARPGEETIVLITDLLDEESFTATDLLEAYLMRWRIEMSHPDYPSSDSLYRGSRAA